MISAANRIGVLRGERLVRVLRAWCGGRGGTVWRAVEDAVGTGVLDERELYRVVRSSRWRSSIGVTLELLHTMFEQDGAGVQLLMAMDAWEGIAALRSVAGSRTDETGRVLASAAPEHTMEALRVLAEVLEQQFGTLGEVVQWVQAQPVLREESGAVLVSRYGGEWSGAETAARLVAISDLEARGREIAVAIMRRNRGISLEELCDVAGAVASER